MSFRRRLLHVGLPLAITLAAFIVTVVVRPAEEGVAVTVVNAKCPPGGCVGAAQRLDIRVRIRRVAKQDTIAVTRTRNDQLKKVRLAPGTYVVEGRPVTPGARPAVRRMRVEVPAGSYAQVRLSFRHP